MSKTAKLEIKDLLFAAVTLVVVGITIALGLQVTGDVGEDMLTNTAFCNSTHQTACGYDYNATVDSIEGTANLSEKLPTIGLVIGIVVVVGLLIGGFMRFRM